MVFFEVEINDVLSTNPFTILFSDFTASVTNFIQFKVDFISIFGLSIQNSPFFISIDTNYSNSTKKINNTDNSVIAYVPLKYVSDIYYYYEADANLESINTVNMPPGATSITITLRNIANNVPINVPTDFQKIILRAHLIGQ